MTLFRVWAPEAQQVELVLNSGRRALSPQVGGWWGLDLPEAGPGTDYRFALNGAAPLPDPRSPWQPGGVHGPSRTVDHAAFAWSDAGWQAPPLSSAVVYELHVGTFTPGGTFDSAIARLPELVDLGITHVELMPVAEFSGPRGWGYDGVDLYAPHHAYGGPDGLKRLVDACHRAGLAVLLDVVYNHLGPAGNYLARYGPYFTPRYTTPWGEAVNYDGADSDEVRRFFIDNALMWLRDYHCDGLRLDAAHAILDTSAMHFLEELAQAVRDLEAALGRHLVIIAESDLNDPRLVRPPEIGGYGLDAQWSDDFHHALHSLLTGETGGYYADFGRMEHLAAALKEAFVYAGRPSPHRRRRHGRLPSGIPGWRFLGFAQNHDQVGNRARGERLSQLLSPGRLKIAAALVLAAPFVPMLFMGEEWGASTPFQYFTGFEDPELARRVRDGRRQEFAAFGGPPGKIPDPGAIETFAASRLNWDERREEPHAGLLAWHRDLIRLRRALPALAAGRLDQVQVQYDPAAGWLLLERGPVGIAFNLGAAPVEVPVRGRLQILLASDPQARLSGGSLVLPPDSVAICR